MRKFIVFVVLAFLASAVPASAQAICWGCLPGDILGDTMEDLFYVARGDNVGLVTARNVRMVRDLTGQLPRSLTEDLILNGSAYGLRASGGRFYPMYDRQMRPMSRRAATITGAMIGTGLGYGFSGDARVTAVGAGVGALIGGFVTHRGNGGQSRDNTVVTPPSERQATYWSHGGPVPAGYRPNAEAQPTWKIFRNRFREAEVRVHVVGESEYISVPAGKEVTRELPGNTKVWAEVMAWNRNEQRLVPTRDPRVFGQSELPEHSGWEFYPAGK